MGVFDVLRRYTENIVARTPSRISTTLEDGVSLDLSVFGNGGDSEAKSIASLWATQPHLRTVVDYIATNIAQLGVHVFRSEVSGDRDRVRDGEIVDILACPNDSQTLSEFLRALVTQMALYADAYVWVFTRKNGVRGLRVLPNEWVDCKVNGFGDALVYRVTGFSEKELVLYPDEVLRFPGWSPAKPGDTCSPVDTLRMILEEQRQAFLFRKQIWEKGGRFTGFLTRPLNAPSWGNEDRARFMAMWRDMTGKGARAGTNPLLEDGIEYKPVGFSAREEQWAEANKIALETVCQVYHVPPVMVGITDDANYSNVTAYARQLYTNTLGSWIVQIEQRLNGFLLPMLGVDKDLFVEFNIEAKLRGDFAEQYKILQTAVGAPFLTRNEARRVLNYRPVDDGDELVTPLNVVTGAVASPTDGGDGRPESADKASEVIAKTLVRMVQVVSSKREAGADWWQPERWEKELATDLENAEVLCAEKIARQVVAKSAECWMRGVNPSLEEIKSCL